MLDFVHVCVCYYVIIALCVDVQPVVVVIVVV